MKRISSRQLLVIAMVGIFSACASTGNGSTRDSRYISNEEIQELASASTLYDVVSQLRPRWLDIRGTRSMSNSSTEIVVFQGNSLLGGPEVLHQFSPGAAWALRYMDGATASASLPGLGTRHIQGAILLITAPERN